MLRDLERDQKAIKKEKAKVTLVKVILNPAIQELSGTMAGMTFRPMYGKQTIMKTPDMSKVKWSKAQKAHRRRFKQAVIYARMAMDNPKVRAHYEKTAAKKASGPSNWRYQISFTARICSKASNLKKGKIRLKQHVQRERRPL